MVCQRDRSNCLRQISDALAEVKLVMAGTAIHGFPISIKNERNMPKKQAMDGRFGHDGSNLWHSTKCPGVSTIQS
jgi:hypothetical protein